MLIVADFPYLKIIWDAETRALITQWQGGFSGRNLREGLLTGLAEYKKYLPHAQWIGDTTEIGVIGSEDQNWIDKEWFPEFLATGVRFMAVVQPRSAVAKYSVKNIVSKVPGSALTVYYCSSLDEARDWMKQQRF